MQKLRNTSSEQLPGTVVGVDINVKGACEKLQRVVGLFQTVIIAVVVLVKESWQPDTI